MDSSKHWQRVGLILTAGLTINLGITAQVQTQSITSTGTTTTKVKVDRGTVVLVDGNDLVVKTEEGRLVHFANVPESARATVDGRELGIHDLVPGMTLERTMTTATTPKTITTVKHVTGKVWYVNPPSSVILTLEDGTNQEFKIPDGQTFNIDGQVVDAWGLKKGMTVSATKVVEVPEVEVEQQEQITGTMPPPPDPPADLPLLVVIVMPTGPPSDVPTAVAETLPDTGSQLSLIGILGALSLISGVGLRLSRVRG